jgi:hypothetical protein
MKTTTAAATTQHQFYLRNFPSRFLCLQLPNLKQTKSYTEKNLKCTRKRQCEKFVCFFDLCLPTLFLESTDMLSLHFKNICLFVFFLIFHFKTATVMMFIHRTVILNKNQNVCRRLKNSR